jgi:hypothetical protein
MPENTPDPVEATEQPEAKTPTLADSYHIEPPDDDIEIPTEAADPAPASETTPSSPATSPAPQHSPRLLRRARDLGLADEDVAGMSSDQLDDTLYLMERQARQMSRRSPEEIVTERSVERTPEPEPEADLGLDEDVDPRIAAALKKLHKENADLKKHIASRDQQQQQTVAQRAIATADRFFNENQAVYGKGTAHDMVPGSKFAKKRNAIYQAAVDDGTAGSFHEKLQRAHADMFGETKPAEEVVPPAIQQRLDKRTEEWSEAGLARPTARKGAPEPNGPKKAAKTLDKLRTANGLKEDDESTDGFL